MGSGWAHAGEIVTDTARLIVSSSWTSSEYGIELQIHDTYGADKLCVIDLSEQQGTDLIAMLLQVAPPPRKACSEAMRLAEQWR
jgi:hypothetical protein